MSQFAMTREGKEAAKRVHSLPCTKRVCATIAVRVAIVCCTLSAACCPLHSVYCTLNVVRCMLSLAVACSPTHGTRAQLCVIVIGPVPHAWGLLGGGGGREGRGGSRGGGREGRGGGGGGALPAVHEAHV